MSSAARTPSITSTWSAIGRAVRRCGMPVAWVVTLGVCAGSAFAVRDVVFPSLSPSAATSLWQPRVSETTVAVDRATTAPDLIDVGAPTSTPPIVFVPVPTAMPEDASSGGAWVGVVGQAGSRPVAGGTAVLPSATTVAPSPGTPAPGGGGHPGTTVPKATTTTGADTNTTVSPTTNPGTGDTLPDDTGGGRSGSGRGGSSNDTLP